VCEKPKKKPQISPLRSPGFPVELVGVGSPPAPFSAERRIRGRCEFCGRKSGYAPVEMTILLRLRFVFFRETRSSILNQNCHLDRRSHGPAAHQGDEKRLGPATTLCGTVALAFVIPSVPGFPTSPLSAATTYVVLLKENHMQLTEATTLDRKSGGTEGSAVQRTFRGNVFQPSAA
jgi:hypothetical protein